MNVVTWLLRITGMKSPQLLKTNMQILQCIMHGLIPRGINFRLTKLEVR
ncbi:hypothetical protein Hanom_Chr08g00719901 [Helianthus anomalus]